VKVWGCDASEDRLSGGRTDRRGSSRYGDPARVPPVPPDPKNTLACAVVIINPETTLSAGQYAIHTKDRTAAFLPQQLHDVETGTLSVNLDDYRGAGPRRGQDRQGPHAPSKAPRPKAEVPPISNQRRKYQIAGRVRCSLVPKP